MWVPKSHGGPEGIEARRRTHECRIEAKVIMSEFHDQHVGERREKNRSNLGLLAGVDGLMTASVPEFSKQCTYA